MKKPKWKAALYLYLFNLVFIGIPLFLFLDIEELTIEEAFRWVGLCNFIIAMHTINELKRDELKDEIDKLKQNQGNT
jgi:hypothetical protein